jgi:hypothetical protein
VEDGWRYGDSQAGTAPSACWHDCHCRLVYRLLISGARQHRGRAQETHPRLNSSSRILWQASASFLPCTPTPRDQPRVVSP